MANNILLAKMPNWVNILVGFLGSLLVVAITGVIGNRADAGFLILLAFIREPMTIELWVALLVILLITIPPTVTWLHYYKAHQIATKLNELDEALLLLLPNLHVTNDPIQALKRLLDDFINRTLEILYLLDGCGIAVYGPDSSQPDYLTTWCQVASPNEAEATLKFYVGKERDRKHGIAGLTFLDGKIRVVHLSRKNDEWQADHSEYIFFSDRHRRRSSYKTLITVPIISMNGAVQESLGVLCLYSNDAIAFDSRAVQDLLFAIANRLSAAMLAARNCQIRPSTP